LTSTASIPIAGKLGDIFGRKLLLIIAVIIFLTGSALCGAANGMMWLVICRGFQGIGAGALQANAFAMIAELFPDSARRARWQGFIAASFGLASVIGPALGGFITDNLVWRWVFYVNLPVGLLAVPALIFYLPSSKSMHKRQIDWWGATTIVGAIVCLLLALTWGGQTEPQGYPWISVQIISLLVGAVALLGLFIWIEGRAAEPIVPLNLFKIPAVRSITVVSFTIGAVMLGALYYIPVFVQIVLGQTASSSGAITTPLALALVATNIVTGQFISRVGLLKLPMLVGAAITILGVGLMLILDAASQTWEVTLFMIVIGIGLGFVMPTMTIVVQESVDRRDLGVGISSVQFFRSIGSTMGVALIGTIVNNSYIENITNATAEAKLPAQLVTAIQQPQSLLNPQVAPLLPASLVNAIREALTSAIHTSFVIALGVSIVILLGVMTVPNIRIKTVAKVKAKKHNTEVASTEQARTLEAGVGELVTVGSSELETPQIAMH
jgi:EmrB/QacA subfamily drug resistance transporter